VVCVVGLQAWRVGFGAKDAGVGLQPLEVGGRPAWVLPNPSGLNAHATPRSLAEHLRQAYWDDAPDV
jgi:TDG/mug DNA glycosylase family protein